MKVILTDKVKGVGDCGATVTVKDGFARNFLFPNKKAILATEHNKTVMERREKRLQVERAKEHEEAVSLSQKIGAGSYTLTVEAGEDEKLYGSVTKDDLAALIQKEGISVDRKQIQLESPIKKLGIYQVPVKLASDVSAEIKVFVVKK